MSTLRTLFPLLIFAGSLAAQQTFDNSGNALLSGTYNFRQVTWEPSDFAGNLFRAVSLYGTIQFNGAGGYQLTGSVFDSNVGRIQAYTFTGTYTISASGYGFMRSPVRGTLFGLVSRGVFIASATEDVTNDLFVAAPATASTAANFTGPYTVSELNFPSGFIADVRHASGRLVPNGAGAIATASISGNVGGSALITQTLTGATYSFAAGVGTLAYGGVATNQSLLTGTRTFYLSPDGNFVFGGSPTSFDFFIGARALEGLPPANLVSGLYYTAGARVRSAAGSVLFTYSGSAKYSGQDVWLHHRRLNWFEDFPDDLSLFDAALAAPDGSFEDFFGMRHIPSPDGTILIGAGSGPVHGIEIALRAPDFTGTGVYLNPTGVLNAASSAPFTVGISAGELLTLYGTGLAPQFLANTDFPKELGGVKVLINGRECPIYYVSATQIAAIVPFGTIENFANVQVVNNGVSSNVVSVFLKQNTAGLFTANQQGSGVAAALHPDFSPVTRANPARPREVIAFFASGMGAVTPPIEDGALGPVAPLSQTQGQFLAIVDGLDARVTFAGIAPQLRGLYQINIEIPANTSAGDVYVEIAGVGSFSSQAQIPVTRSGGATELPVPRSAAPERRRRGEGAILPSDSRRRLPSENTVE